MNTDSQISGRILEKQAKIIATLPTYQSTKLDI